jgi:hypothetical protein
MFFAEMSQIKNSFLLKYRKSKQLFGEISQIKRAFC